MERLIPLFFVVYMVAVVVSSVLKRMATPPAQEHAPTRREPMRTEPERPAHGWPAPTMAPAPEPARPAPATTSAPATSWAPESERPAPTTTWAPGRPPAAETATSPSTEPWMFPREDDGVWRDASSEDDFTREFSDDWADEEVFRGGDLSEDARGVTVLRGPAPRSPDGTRRAMRRWLSPAKLREAIIYAELLSPPRAFRPYSPPRLKG